MDLPTARLSRGRGRGWTHTWPHWFGDDSTQLWPMGVPTHDSISRRNSRLNDPSTVKLSWGYGIVFLDIYGYMMHAYPLYPRSSCFSNAQSNISKNRRLACNIRFLPGLPGNTGFIAHLDQNVGSLQETDCWGVEHSPRNDHWNNHFITIEHNWV